MDKAKIKANLSSCVRIPVEERRENILKQKMDNERITSLWTKGAAGLGVVSYWVGYFISKIK